MQLDSDNGSERFCTSCGTVINANASFCSKCGGKQAQASAPVPMSVSNSSENKGVDEKFCSSCSAVIKKEAELCPKCGVRQQQAVGGKPAEVNRKSWGAALALSLLPVFFCLFGIHRFYTGHIVIGLIQLFTLGGCGLWQLIDVILILCGSYTDKNGRPLAK